MELVGRQLGDFQVVERVGGGGFGELYRASQLTLHRDAVIKVMASGLAEDARARFTREAQLASRLDHPYAAHVYAFGVEPDGLQWIAMELVRGISLADLLAAQGPLPIARFVPLFQAICQVVQVAHEQGIVHRDIKPSNVMVVARAGVLLPKLLDFGIARLYTPAEVVPLAGEELAELLAQRAAQIVATPQDRIDLTSDALYLGSPPYMAPELWLNPHGAGPACDLYALGILAYECLTGQRPYDGATVQEVARAHLGRLPELPATLPAGLWSVLDRAVAKRAADRPVDALTLARAVDDACTAGTQRPLPRCAPELVAGVLARAPQPIAESLAAADAAGRPEDARAQYTAVLELVAQYVGVLALASWGRLGRADSGGLVGGLVRRLARGGLSGAEWFELVAAITRPFARRRDAFPLPELVNLSDANGIALAAPEALDELVAAVGSALGAVHDLFEYELVVVGDRGCERWTGNRRQPRALVEVTTDAPPGSVLLVDRTRAPVVRLEPFAQAISPTAAAPRELFLLAGRGRYGARLIAQPHGFERHDAELASWLDEIVGDHGVDHAAAAAERAPYRGLASFAVGDSEFFYGRERESEYLANHLRAHSFAAVVGSSGAGKSSFVQAGVLPLLPSTWRPVVMRPGVAPWTTLRDQLAGLPGPTEPVPADPSAGELLAWLEAYARRRGETIVLIVDQGEELVTLCHDERQRTPFAQLLASVRDGEPVRVVMTLRDDFLMRLGRLPGLAERLPTGIHLVATPSRAELRRILVEPARRMGYELEDAALVDEMVEAVADNSSALALLSFTALRLWELRDQQFRKLRRRVYASLGGVGGALAQHAEDVIVTMSPAEREVVRDAFRNLVTGDGTRQVIAKAELLELLGGGDAARVIEALVQARLVVTGEAAGGITIEITHEALLESWPRLVGWRREDAETARVRDQLRASARQWDARARQRGLLWRGDALVEYRLWRTRYRGRLSEIEEAFGAACIREHERSARRRRVLWASAFTLLAMTAVVLYTFGRRARGAAADAIAKTIALLEEQGRRDLLDAHPVRAAGPLVRAYRLGDETPRLRFLLRRALVAIEGEGPVLGDHATTMRRLALSEDATRLITESDDNTLRLWDTASGARLAELALPGPVRLAAAPDGSRAVAAAADRVIELDPHHLTVRVRFDLPAKIAPLALAVSGDATGAIVGDADGKTHVIDLATVPARELVDTSHAGAVVTVAQSADAARWASGGVDGKVVLGAPGAAPRVLSQGAPVVSALAFSPDGALLASAGSDGAVRLWRSDSGEPVRTLDGHTKTVRAIAFSPDGRQLITASEDGTSRLWPVAGGTAKVLVGHAGTVYYATFDHGGAQALTAGADGTVRVWDTASGSEIAALDAHAAEVWSATFDRTDRQIASASFDGTARLWQFPQLDRRLPLAGGPLYAATFDRTGTLLATGGDDGRARIFDRDGRALETVTGGGKPLHVAALAPDGRHLLTASDDGHARLWQLGSKAAPVELEVPAQGVSSGCYRPDGAEIALGGGDGVVRVFDGATGTLVRRLPGHHDAIYGLAYSADGRMLAAASDDRTVIIWSSETGAILRTIGPLSASINGVGFEPRGTRIATGGADGVVAVYAVADGGELGHVRAHEDMISTLVWSADGERIVTASYDRTVGVWDSRSLRLLTRLARHTDGVLAVAYQPGTEQLLSAGIDGAAWLTDLSLESRDVAQLRAPDDHPLP